MRKLTFFLAVVAGVATISCNKLTDASESTQSENYIFTIKANFPEDESVKTTYAGDKTFSWSAGDQISVLFHKGDENKFFTLTNETGAAATATFSGEIEAGYEIGASDGEHVKWALFPASDAHTYTAGETNPVSFNEIAENDFTAVGAHFSVNIPMYAHGDGSDNFAFKHLTGVYKITFNGIPATVTKVKLTAENIGNGYYLSGNSPIKLDGSTYYLDCYNGSGSKVASWTNAVNSGEVTFYIPYRAWERLQPSFVLQNMTEGEKKGFTIKEFTASAAIGSGVDGTKANLEKMIILPTYDLSAYGEGVPFISKLGVNWATIDMYPTDDLKDAFPGDGTRIVDWKATSDATNIYFFYKITASVPYTSGVWGSYINTGYDLDNNNATGGDPGYSLGAGMEAYSIIYPFTNAANSPVTFRAGVRSDNKTKTYSGSEFTQTSSSEVATYGSLVGDFAYVESSVPRTRLGSPAASSTIRVMHSFGYTNTAAQTITLQ